MTQIFDPLELLSLIREQEQGSGAHVSVEKAMRNTAVSRCVHLISFAIGMLPLHIMNSQTKEKAKTHPLYPLLRHMPNDWQTAFNFRQLMQRRALVDGNAYALIIRSGKKIIRLVPVAQNTIRPVQRRDWKVEYEYRPSRGSKRTLGPQEVLHIYADSHDGIVGLSMVKVAAEAISIAAQADKAASRLFENGMMVGGALSHPAQLSQEAYDRLKASMKEDYTGEENAGKWMVLEEGLKANHFASTAKEAQQIETRRYQVEEIARAFGVPRPFLGMDDTSWGSGIDVLGQIFVRYALNPWFTAWEQAIKRSLIDPRDWDIYEARYNPGALIRGNMKDQAEFFAKALGSGGHQPWMGYDEIRDISELPARDIDPNPLAAQKTFKQEPSK